MKLLDQLGRPINIGDKILAYGVNRMDLRTVICANEDGLYFKDDVNPYNSLKCVVVTEQIENNKIKYPEYFI